MFSPRRKPLTLRRAALLTRPLHGARRRGELAGVPGESRVTAGGDPEPAFLVWTRTRQSLGSFPESGISSGFPPGIRTFLSDPERIFQRSVSGENPAEGACVSAADWADGRCVPSLHPPPHPLLPELSHGATRTRTQPSPLKLLQSGSARDRKVWKAKSAKCYHG